MGDQNTILTDAEARHLLRRATFDGSPASLVRSRIAGLTRGAAVDKLLPRVPSKYRPVGRYIEQVQAKWIENLVALLIEDDLIGHIDNTFQFVTI